MEERLEKVGNLNRIFRQLRNRKLQAHSKPTALEIFGQNRIYIYFFFQNRSRMDGVDKPEETPGSTSQRCPERGEVIAHFATIRTMQEDLASMESH